MTFKMDRTVLGLKVRVPDWTSEETLITYISISSMVAAHCLRFLYTVGLDQRVSVSVITL